MREIPYATQWIEDDDIEAVKKALKDPYLTQGPAVKAFEEAVADYCGAEYAVAVNSGTSALHGAYHVCGLKNNDEFVTSPNTFVATANAGLYLGAKPVFVDIEYHTGTIDTFRIEENITEKTKLIVPVHYAGQPVNLEKIFDLAKKYSLLVIEDACHALGARYKGEKIGSCKYSDMTVFSFHPVKHITTGEGGAILTNNEEFYKKLLMFRNHGITKTDFIKQLDGQWYYEMQFLGYNYRITDIQAALGSSQLKKLDKFVEKRRAIAKNYEKAFLDNPYFDIPVEKEYASSSYHLYYIRLKDKYENEKKEIFSKMREKNIGVQVHYIPVYLQPYYQNLGYEKGLCPVAEDFYHREISIPLYPSMIDEDINYVIETILKIFRAL